MSFWNLVVTFPALLLTLSVDSLDTCTTVFIVIVVHHVSVSLQSFLLSDSLVAIVIVRIIIKGFILFFKAILLLGQ
jgi:hypothetical protein